MRHFFNFADINFVVYFLGLKGLRKFNNILGNIMNLFFRNVLIVAKNIKMFS